MIHKFKIQKEIQLQCCWLRMDLQYHQDGNIILKLKIVMIIQLPFILHKEVLYQNKNGIMINYKDLYIHQKDLIGVIIIPLKIFWRRKINKYQIYGIIYQ